MVENSRAKLRFQRILHPTDLSEGSEIAFAHALKLALATEGRLEIVHVGAHASPEDLAAFPHARDMLARWGVLPAGASQDDLRRLHVGIRKVNMAGTDPVKRIMDEMQFIPEDLIVLATHQRKGFDRWLHKEVAGRLSRHAHVATLFVPFEVAGFVDVSSGRVTLRNVLLPIDTAPHPQPAVDAARDVAQALDCVPATFTLLHIGTSETAFSTVKLPPDTSDESTWNKILRDVDYADVAQPILQAAGECYADLIAITTEGHHGFLDALRGSTTERVLRDAKCPVLVAPAARR